MATIFNTDAPAQNSVFFVCEIYNRYEKPGSYIVFGVAVKQASQPVP